MWVNVYLWNAYKNAVLIHLQENVCPCSLKYTSSARNLAGGLTMTFGVFSFMYSYHPQDLNLKDQISSKDLSVNEYPMTIWLNQRSAS